MQPKLFKTSLAEFIKAEWGGKNESGWNPVGDRVLIKPDVAASKSQGGVDIPEDIVDRMTLAAEAGVIVAVGEGAFKWNSDRITQFEGYRPQPGDRVSMNRYSGQLLKGQDGLAYRILDSIEVGGVEIHV